MKKEIKKAMKRMLQELEKDLSDLIFYTDIIQIGYDGETEISQTEELY